MKHDAVDAELRARATDYVMGELADGERAPYEAHLGSCTTCEREVRALEAIATVAGDAFEPPAPSPDLWEHISAGIKTPAPSETAFVQPRPESWRPTPIGGLEVCHLHTDRQADRVTYLVRAAPGVSVPPHRHTGPEECVVLSGQLTCGDVAMRAGDYQRSDAGSLHAVQSTQAGCLLLIVSSSADALVA